jgi:hypothetical protein
MKTKPLVTLILLLAFYAVHSQDKEGYTFLIDKDTKNIVFLLSKDTIGVGFSIYKPGFETKEAREKHATEYRKNTDSLIRKKIHYSYDFWSSKSPERLDSLPADEKPVSIERFRSDPGPLPKNIYLIYKVRENYYLKWHINRIPYK